MDNAQGGHELLHLQTNSVVKRRRLTKVPITPSIIKQVDALAVLDGMPKGRMLEDNGPGRDPELRITFDKTEW